MKNKILQIIVVLFLSTGLYGQVSVTIQSLQYTNNGQTTIGATNCGNIDLGTSTSTSINFGVNLTKPLPMVVGDGGLYVYTKKSSSDYKEERRYTIIQESSWSQPSSGNSMTSSSASFSINSSEFNTNGGVLYVVFKSNSNVEYESCSFTISKTPVPTFTLSPTATQVYCNNFDSKNFAVTPSNIPNGANVTYQWSYTGWSGNVTNTMSSITLTPLSNNLPSSVTVTPYIDGVSYPSKTCTVTRGAYTSPASISGATGICSGTSTYTIANVLAGQTVSWSLTNPSIASLSNQTNGQVDVTFSGNGAQTLKATVTNACNQPDTKSFLINTGSTTLVSNATIAAPTNFCYGSSTFAITGVLSDQNVNWSLSNTGIASLSGSSNTQTTLTTTGSGLQTITATITNTCGQTASKSRTFWTGAPGLSKLDTSSGVPYDQYNLPLGSSTGNPYWIFSCFSNDAVVTSFKITKNGQTFYKTAVSGKVTLTADELGMVGGQTLSIKVTPINSCGQITKEISKSIYRPTLCESGIGLGCNLGRPAPTETNIYTIFPNPSKDIVNINLKNQTVFPNQEAKIAAELFDLFGNKKSTVQIRNNTATFSVSELNKGIYILKIYINNQIEIHKIVVE